jgi:hypothetical protein
MKVLSVLLILALVLFTSCGVRPQTGAGNSFQAAPEGAKALILQASYNPNDPVPQSAPYSAIPVLNDTSNTCLSCHGPTYEDLRAKTADYQYDGQIVQPHAYVDLTKKETHDSTIAIDCLQCHTAHALPVPQSAPAKPILDYCFDCHHTGALISCVECHGFIP